MGQSVPISFIEAMADLKAGIKVGIDIVGRYFQRLLHKKPEVVYHDSSLWTGRVGDDPEVKVEHPYGFHVPPGDRPLKNR